MGQQTHVTRRAEQLNLKMFHGISVTVLQRGLVGPGC